MHKLNRIIPGFLKKADLYLLENHPMIWVSKIHYVAFFSATLIALAGLWNLLIPMNFANPPAPEAAFTILFIPAAIGAAIWALFQLVFNVDKNYGKSGLLSDLGRYGLYLLILGMFLSIPWMGGTLTNLKIATSISSENLVEDINSLNRGYLIFNSRPREVDYADYYSFPFTPYGFNSGSIFSDDELRKLDLSVRTRSEVATDLATFIELFLKYGGEGEFGDPMVLDNYFDGRRYENNSYLVDSYPVERNLQEVASAKSWNFFLMDWDVILGFLFGIFCLSVTMIMLKNVKIKHFLIATIVGFLGIPVIALLSELANEMHIADNEDAVTAILLGLFAFLAFQSFSIFRLRKFSGFKAISLILFNTALPFAGLFGFYLVNEYFHYGSFLSQNDLWIALYLGAGAYSLVWVHVLKGMYRKLQALPS